jgi:DNA-directed RNA polymerase specialized sigma24 family protein
MGAREPPTAVRSPHGEEVDRVDRSEGSFPDFVTDVEPALLGTAFLLTGRRRDAQDAVVAALASVHRHWRRLDPATAAVEARRALVADVLRRPGTAQQTVEPDGADDDVPAADRAWLQALAGLPTRTRAALVLRLYDGLDDDGTAELLGEDLSTVVAEVEAALDVLTPRLLDDVPAEPAAAAPQVADDEPYTDDPEALFRRPEVPDPAADPDAAFRRPETPTAPRRPAAARHAPAAPLLAQAPDDDDPDAIYRRPGTPASPPPGAPAPRPPAPATPAALEDPDAIYRRPG